MKLNKSVKYYKVKTDTFKAIKHLDNSVDLYKMKDSSKNQNCWTNKDYVWLRGFQDIIKTKKYIKEMNR